MSIKFNFTVQQHYDKGKIQPGDIGELRKFLEDQKMPTGSDEMILLFFVAVGCDMEAAKRFASVHYRARRDMPEIFKDRKLSSAGVRQQWDAINLAIMPQRTKEGFVVIIFQFSDPVASHFHMDIFCKLLLMTTDSALYQEPVPGFIFVADLKKMGLKHLFRLQIGLLRKLLKFVGEGLLRNLKAVHNINGGYVLEKLSKIFKAFCSPELYNLLLFHPSNMKMEDFYKNCVPKMCLPSDYGGDGESMEKLTPSLWSKLEDIEEFYEEESNHRLPFENQAH